MEEKKLSEELRHCMEGDGCSDCAYCNEEITITICEELLQKAYEKIKECEKIEEEEKMICTVGDKIWSITSIADYSSGEYKENLLPHPQEKKIVSITICKNGIILYHVKDRAFASFEFGETVFLTKEEAEQVLNEKKKVLGSEHE